MNWRQFFEAAKPWCFQAAPNNPPQDSIGAMEAIYQAFKARMDEENWNTGVGWQVHIRMKGMAWAWTIDWRDGVRSHGIENTYEEASAQVSNFLKARAG